jgi:heptosyltransferase-3
MTASILDRILGRLASGPQQRDCFTLPGALHDGLRVLFVDSGDLTDLLFAMPLVEEIRRRFPQTRVGLVCEEAASHLALSCARFHELIVYEEHQLKPHGKPFLAVVKALEEQPWDVAVLLAHGEDLARETLAYRSGAQLRLGPNHEGGYPRINCAVRCAENGAYPSQRTGTWGRLLGVPLDGVPLRWPLPEARLRQAAQLVHFNKPRKEDLFIGVDPGVAKSGAVLSVENLALVANHVAGHVRSKLIVLTADRDAARQAAFATLLRGGQLDLPRPTLHETILLLAQCDLLVAGNTDLFHFAAALGVRTLGIFTPADEAGWMPAQSPRLAVLQCAQGEQVSLPLVLGSVQALLR